MKDVFAIFITLFTAQIALCLIGGRQMRIAEFPFVVLIERDNEVLFCTGIILDHLQIVIPDPCVERQYFFSIGYISVNVIPIANSDPPKKYKGYVAIVDDPMMPPTIGYLSLLVIRLEYPGMQLVPRKDQDGRFPTHAPFGPRIADLIVPSDVIIVGMNNKVGTMTIVAEERCFSLQKLLHRVNGWVISAKQFLGNNLICAEARDDNQHQSRDEPKPVNIPSGQACETDVGAPVLQNGVVIGLVIQALCSKNYSPMTHVTHILRLHGSDIPRERLSPL
ncbi:hypothetical protein GE061_019304 [Apolygus lucorum]|uniref:Uncharacterized protein n=1 Tax=Apolygus lucorum TaxID=248454 RepID=A0A6A4K570_APOLU|nr:hypothetical protein GE061_019304 [Apolygus lucorum]